MTFPGDAVAGSRSAEPLSELTASQAGCGDLKEKHSGLRGEEKDGDQNRFGEDG